MKQIRPYLFIFYTIMTVCGCHPAKHIPQEGTTFTLSDTMVSKIFPITVIKQPFIDGIHLNGTIEPNPDRVVSFMSLVSGIVSDVRFSVGDKVEKGQILAELESTELGNLQSELKNIKSKIQVAERQLQSIKSMYDDGISSQKDLMEAQSNLDVLITDREKVQSFLQLFSASTVKNVFLIKAPLSGVITSKSISAGSRIAADEQSLFTISDLSEVWALINVYTNTIKDIHEGMEIEIDALFYPGEVFKGTITSISQVYDEQAKVLKARVVLPNIDMKLKPGMMIEAIAFNKVNTEKLCIPSDAIVFDDNQSFVVVYRSQTDIEIRKIETLSQYSGTTFIAHGLQEGEKVITRNQLLVYEEIKNFLH